jgi:hypothetical protein
LVKGEILANGITPDVAAIDQRGTRVVVDADWKILAKFVTTFVILIY